MTPAPGPFNIQINWSFPRVAFKTPLVLATVVAQTQVCPPVWLNSPVAVPVTPPECPLKEQASFRSKFSLRLMAEVQAFCDLSHRGGFVE